MNTSKLKMVHSRYFNTLFLIIIRSIFFVFFFSVLFIICFTSFIFYKTHYEYKNRIFPGVYVNNLNVSGFSKKDFYKAIQNQNEIIAHDFSATIVYEDVEVATFSASMLKVRYEPKELYASVFNIGRKIKNKSDLKHFVQQFLLGRTIKILVFPSYNLESLQVYLNTLEKKYAKPPKNALFEVDGNRVIAFEEDRPGIGIDKNYTTNAITNHFKQLPLLIGKPIYIKVPVISIKPKFTMTEANDFGIVEPIGVGISNFAHSAGPRIYNIKLVSSRINGALVPKGETFSFNKTAGDISFKTGYQAGYAIISGKTVLSDGGGVCQESTTIFRAALNAGLPIVEWKNHSYRVRYYEQGSQPGFDATVYAPTVDFKFKNDTPAHILIQSHISDDTMLTVTLYGKKDGRVASVSASRVWGVIPPPEPLYTDDPTIPKGTIKQVDYPAWGAKASFDYTVIRDMEVLQKRTFLSVYRPWQAAFLVGTQ